MRLDDRHVNAARSLLKGSDYLLTLIEAYREDTLTENERTHLWVGIHDLALRLATRHYKEKQHLPRTDWYKSRETPQEEKHAIRMELIYSFIKEFKLGTPATGVLFALHKRYSYLELLVECKFYGMDIHPEYNVPRRTNTTVLRDIILGVRLQRTLRDEWGRLPTFREILVEYVLVHRIEKGKMVTWKDTRRFCSRAFAFLTIKNAYYAIEYEDWQSESCPDMGSI